MAPSRWSQTLGSWSQWPARRRRFSHYCRAGGHRGSPLARTRFVGGVVVGELGHHGGGGRHSDALVFHPAQRDVVTEHGERADCVGGKGDLVAIPAGMQLECAAARRR
jgi:hypothetical protein